MVVDQTENFVRGKLSSSINNSTTTFPVDNASTFPDPSNGEYNLVCWDDSEGRPDEDSDVEVVRVTGRDTNNNELTVTRGQENTSGASHPNDSALHLSATAKVFEDIETHDHTTADENTVPNSGLTNSSITVTSGDGLKNGGSVSLGSSTTLDVEPADFAGTLLSDDGSDNLQVDEGSISHDSIDQTTVSSSDHHTRPSAGDGLTDDTNTFNINVSDFAGTLLSDDGSDNLQVDEGSISHDSIDQTTVNADDHHTDPTAGTGITDEGTNQFGIATDGVGTNELNTPFTFLDDIFGDPVALDSNSLALTDNSLTGRGHTIWDPVDEHIPQGRLQNDSVTVTSGDGLKNGGSVSLGGSTTLDVEPADFAGTLLSDDGSDNLQVDEGSISHDSIDQTTVSSSDHHTRPSAGDGLTDDTNTFNINVSDFAGTALEDDGSDNLQVSSGGITDTELGVESFSYDPGMTQFGDTSGNNKEINRIVLQSGETLVVERIELRKLGGGSNSNVTLDVRDVTGSTTIGSQTLGGTTKYPGSSGTANTVIIRISNNNGGPVDVSPRVQGYITGV